ncbi:MAG: SulP family inorganic anion transporter [Acidimicrobiaceae bacterium]|nr:SulP family inorganic anion transporter [Acidimicrobiaceae bacterium]
MAKSSPSDHNQRTPIGERAPHYGIKELLSGVTRKNAAGQVLAGVALLAIAIPEQLATSQLAGVPAFAAMIAFIAATLVFVVFGSNPIMSVGADSTIAPLFAVALLRIALPNTSQYYGLVAATSVITGLMLVGVGLFRLGWLADFMSVPIVTGFLAGIGVIIAVHQLPHVLGVASSGDSVLQRLESLSHHLGHVSGWSLALALATLAIMVTGEMINPRLPWALAAVALGAIVAAGLSLSQHGVELLGSVSVGLPQWRLTWFSAHDWSVVLTTSLTMVVVIMSQSAATARSSADEIGVADDLSRDFLGVGLANVATGLLGTIPVDASPARTTVASLAGGRTKLVAVVAGLGALVLSPLAGEARTVPLASLAGVLLFIAGRLVKIGRLRSVWQTSRVEFTFAIVAWVGVVFLGVEVGLAIAVALAILAQLWHAARPRMVEMGRRRGTTSWEPYDAKEVERVDHVLALLFDEDLFFANAGVFRRELHDVMRKYPKTRHVVLDAVAISDIDFTALATLSQIATDLDNDHVSLSFARASATVRGALARAKDQALRDIRCFDSVDSAVTHALKLR